MTRARKWKKAHKQRFKQEKYNPDASTLEKRRKQLAESQQRQERERQRRERVRERVVIRRQVQPASKKERLKQALKEQISQGGRQFHLEQRARSKEFREQNQLPGGVLGSDVPGLVEEQRKKQSEMAEKLKDE